MQISILTILLSFVLSLTSVGGDIIVKSRLSTSGDRALIHLQLPDKDNVDFTLYARDESPLHHWTSQQLVAGQHMLSLPLPELASGSYLLVIHVGEDEFKQLVLIP